MRTPSKIVFILVCCCFIKGSYSICYKDLGCFDNKKPFDNALFHLPQSPAEIDVTYKLFTRLNPDSPQILKAEDSFIEVSNFNRSTRTKFIIHGYKHSASSAWDIKMKDEILEREDANVILVNWVKGARLGNYAQVAANTRVVGALLSVFMQALIRVAHQGYSKKIHLIGHSLGAHVAGYAGERIPETGRITGLDPAGPFFECTEPKVRLDPTDAEFVDVIHTDKTCFGIKSSIGHVDFYPNGGKHQPGCKDQISDLVCEVITGNVKDIDVSIACSHMRAISLFTESINSNCWFFSFPSKYATTCDSVCAIMGYDAPSGDPRGDHFLNTQPYQPFCIPMEIPMVQVSGM